MQLKYNRQDSLSSIIFRTVIKFLFLLFILIIAIFLIEKINFPSPKKNYKIDITNEIKKLK